MIVSAFLDQVADVEGWTVSTGPTPGIRVLRSSQAPLPDVFGGDNECLIAADAAAVIKAREEQFRRAGDVVVLGPTEDAFQELVKRASLRCEGDLLAGAAAVDLASLTGYTLFVYAADLEHHDGLRRARRTVPFLIRYSGAGAFAVAWESVMNLAATTVPPTAPAPAARFEADASARAAVEAEAARLRCEQRAITTKTRADVDDIERRYKRQVRNLPTAAKREALDRFALIKTERLEQLDLIDEVSHTAPRILGWIKVAGGARAEELGRDPDSEKVAIARVVAELEGLGWVVDDRQTAGLGYDLFARRPGYYRSASGRGQGFHRRPTTRRSRTTRVGTGPTARPRLLALRGSALRQPAGRRHPLPRPRGNLCRRTEADQTLQDSSFPAPPPDGGHMTAANRKIIDAWFPCAAVDDACGNPTGSGKNEKAIFTWFASRPIAQARAAVATALLPDLPDTRPLIDAAISGDRGAIDKLAVAVSVSIPRRPTSCTRRILRARHHSPGGCSSRRNRGRPRSQPSRHPRGSHPRRLPTARLVRRTASALDAPAEPGRCAVPGGESAEDGRRP